jgi:hypothetical protein
MPPSEQPRSTEPPDDEPLRVEPLVADLRERLRETTEAARRLAGEARADSGGAEREAPPSGFGKPPPRGWESPRSEQRPPADIADLVLLAEQTGVLLAEVARGLVPAELRQQFLDALRELLVAVRALIDWYLERIGSRREESVEVEDIPIG